jgi:hypothetical protein
LILNDGEHPENPIDVEVHDRVVEMFRGFQWDLSPILETAPLATAISGLLAPNPGAISLHAAVHTTVALLHGTARAIQLIDLARSLEISGTAPVIEAVRDAGIERHARFVYPSIAFTARETGSLPCVTIRDLLAPFVPEAMRAWTATASLTNVSWSNRRDRASFDRSAVWSISPTDRARMLSYTLLPQPAWIADIDGGLGGPAAIPGRYARHYYQLLRRVI